ncbi:MAG: GNAT family N-acetyltransferase, partial [Pelosinus sp.]|nr:GNAT family N-acetyltransferase [Pelosinus sp.]
MLTNLVLRKAERKDIEAMVGLISLVFALEEDFVIDDAKQRQGLEMLFLHPAGRYLLVAEYQGVIIGMCSAQLLISTAEGGWKALVEDVVVRKEYRGKGIGKSMLADIEVWAKS